MTVEIQAWARDFDKAVGQASTAMARMPSVIQGFNQAWQSTQIARMASLGVVAPGLAKAAANTERHEAEREHREWLERENLKWHFSSLGTDYVQRARMWERQCLEVFAINGNYRRTALLFTLFILLVAIFVVL